MKMLSLLTCLLTVALSASGAQKPNVILIFADDLGYGDLSCYGAAKLKTPNIDSLAKEGRLFTDAHSASAVCTPSRYALLTGDYPFRQGESGIWGPLSHSVPLIIDEGKLTLSKVFKQSGYSTACIGKWHLGFGKGKCDWNKPLRPGPQEMGFDYYFGVPKVNSGFPYVYVENDRILGWEPQDPLVFRQKPYSKTTTYPPKAGRKTPNAFGGAKKAHALYDDEKIATLMTEKAVSWIQKQTDKPFFLYFPTTNIHHPFTPHPRFKGTSDCGLYGDFVHELDWMVGELLKTLKEKGVADNTMIIFTSDNGGMYNVAGKAAFKMGHAINGPLLGFKFGSYEGGHRVPFVVKWPGKVKAGTKSSQLLCNVDLLATMAALLDYKLESDDAVDSYNMLEAFTAEPSHALRDHAILASNSHKNLAFRRGKWVYISGRGDGGNGLGTRGGAKALISSGRPNSDIGKKNAPQEQLYNLEKDLGQTQNVIRDYPEIAREMKLLLRKYRRQAKTRQ